MSELYPYPVYKDSGVPWLGGIPEHWRQAPGRACYRAKHVPNFGLVESTVLSLSYGQIVVKPAERLHGLVPASFETYQIIEPGDIVVRPTDLQNDWNSLRFGLAKDRGIITSAYLCFHTANGLTREYGHLLLHTYDLVKVFYGLGSGLRQNLDWNDFKYLPCLVPPLHEQGAIVRFLDHADRQIRRYIRAKKKLITLLNEQKQAIVHRTVTRGLDMNAPTRPSCIEWLGNVPQDWRRVRLKQVATIQTGITLGKVYGDSPLIERPYLRVANVQSGRVELSKITTVRLPPAEAAGATLVAGDVLMTEGGDIDKLGRGCVWRGEISECLHQNHVFAVRTDARTLLPEFLVAVMGSRHGRAYFQTTAKQTTNLAATNSTTLGNLPLWLPTTDVQQQILDWVAVNTAEIDGAAVRALREVGLLHEYRSRLVADVVTGKIDVREAAPHLPDASTPSEDEGLLAEEAAESDAAELDDAEAEVPA